MQKGLSGKIELAITENQIKIEIHQLNEKSNARFVWSLELINSELKGWKTLYCSARTHFKWGKMRRLDERQSHCFEKLSWKNWLVFWHDAHDVPTIVWEVVRLHICIFQEKSLYPNPSLGWVGWGLKFSLEMTYLGMIYHIQKDSCGLNAHNATKKCLTFENFVRQGGIWPGS